MENKAIAETIFKQLGGNQFMAMTGAKNLAFGTRCLSFKANRRFFTIALSLDDTYKVSVYTLSGAPRDFAEHIHADQLRATFETFSGLSTSL